MFHLAYILLSFLFTRKFTYFMTVFIILPVYSLEFILVYGMGIPHLVLGDFYKAKDWGINFLPVTK